MTKITLAYTSNRNTERVYINDAAGTELGFFEFETIVRARGKGAYDLHRTAKGDTATLTAGDCTFHSDILTEEVVLAAIGVDAAAIAATERDGAPCAKFATIAKRARGGYPTWYGNTPTKEVAKMKRLRDKLTFAL